MPPRAAPLSPDDRRTALVTATLPLLREHGRAVTTRQIATAAGVAEGTIFRVFDTKEELVDAAVDQAWDPTAFAARLDALDRTLPLPERTLALVRLFHERFTEIVGLMSALGMVGPPDRHQGASHAKWRERLDLLLREVFADVRDELRVPLPQFLHTLRVLTFAGSHHQIGDGRTLTPEEITDLLLYGAAKEAR